MTANYDDQTNRYFEERSALIAKDRALRTDHAQWDLLCEISSLSVNLNLQYLVNKLAEKEKKADAKIKALRDWEVQNLWAPKDQDDMFPGMGFLTGKICVDPVFEPYSIF